MKRIPKLTKNSPNSFLDFIKILRKYKQSSIVSLGSKILWDLFNESLILKNKDAKFIINVFGPKIILLALATTNNNRILEITEFDQFYDLCKLYVNIPASITNKNHLKEETDLLLNALLSHKNNKIPAQFLTNETLKSIPSELFIQRNLTDQGHFHLMNMNEFYNDYLIMKALDEKNSDLITKILHAIFNLTIEQIFCSAFGLLTIAKNNSGLIIPKIAKHDQELKKKLNVNIHTCHKVASELCYKETELFSKWYETKILSSNTYYQMHIPTPLNFKPLIYLNKTHKNLEIYLIPSPILFIRSFRQALFSCLFSGKEKNIIGNLLGKAIEDHIFNCLKQLLINKKIEIINDSGKHADIFISLNKIDLVLEIKTNIGQFPNTPEELADVWQRLYTACQQCQISITKFKKDSRTIIPIIIIANHMVAESLTFQSFAIKNSLFGNIKIGAIAFLSWNSLEYILSNTTIDDFENELIRAYESSPPYKLIDLLNISFKKRKQELQLDYIKDAKKAIFGN